MSALLRAALAVLSRVGNPALIPLGLQQVHRLVPAGEAGCSALLDLAGDRSWVGRYLAARHLGDHYQLRPEAIWQALAALARDPERVVREGAAWGFAGLLSQHGQEAWARVELVFADGTVDPFVRRAVLYAAAPLIRSSRPDQRQTALRLVELAAHRDRTGASRQLGALLVGRELATRSPDEAVALAERWAAADDEALQWQAARALTAAIVAASPVRARALVRRLAGSPHPRVRSALQGAARGSPELACWLEARSED